MSKHSFRIPINPVPASRPRVSKWSTYYKEPYNTFLKTIPDIVKEVWRKEPLTSWLIVRVFVFPKRPKKPTNPYPAPDYDNYAKAVCDGMEGVVYENDKYIVDGRCVKAYAQPGEDGYVLVEIEEIDGRPNVPD